MLLTGTARGVLHLAQDFWACTAQPVLQHGLSCHVLENSGISTGRACTSLCFWKMQYFLGTAPLRTATAGKLSESHAAHTASPMLPKYHSPCTAMGEMCCRASHVQWHWADHATWYPLHTQLSWKIPGWVWKSSWNWLHVTREPAGKWHSYLHQGTARSLIFLTNMYLAYPHFPVFYSKGENTGMYRTQLLLPSLCYHGDSKHHL